MSHSIPNYNNPGHQSRAASSSSILSQIPPPLNGLSSTKRDSINSIQNQNRVPSAAGGIGAGQPQSSLHQQLFQRSEVRVEDGILDRPLNRTRGAEVGMATWAFLFAEIVSYSQSRSDSVDDLEKRLSRLGYEAGTRILSLLLLRNTQSSGMKDPRREHRLIPALQFVHTQVYKYIFGKPADGLERSVEGEDEYMLTLNQPPLTQHVSVPRDMSQLSVEAYTAGLVEGVLDGLNLPARVTAHTVGTDQFPQRTVILIKLDPSVMDREAVLGK